jgi:hypothetical protein
MDRKEFLRACTGGLCFCAAAALPAKAADAPAKPDDWRLGFVKKRWAHMLSTLSQKMDEPALSAALEDMGAFCASQNDEKTKQFAGDVDGFCKAMAEGSVKITRDDARKVYTSTYAPGADCFCPFNSLAAKTPGVMCNCSVGWAKHNWSIVLKKEPKVVLKEAVLRGGKACVFEITAA